MKKRLFALTLLASLIVFSLVANTSAITGRMGNSRMVLNLDVDEEARRYILVQNVNDVPLTIEMMPSGDLEDNVEFEENQFTLEPGEEKRAYFTIYADESGTTETKINVMFKPPQGNGVGLSASVIVIAGDGESDEDSDQTDMDEQTDTEPGNENSGPTGMSVQDGENSLDISPITILTVSSALLVAVFLILLIFSGKKKVNSKKRSRRPRE